MTERAKLNLNIVFDFEAILFLEETHGMNIIDGGLTQEDSTKPKTYLNLLHAGLMHTNREITEEEAREKIKGVPFSDVVKLIIAAVREAIGAENPVENEAVVEDPDNTDDGDGKSPS
jgi:hypothetical protein